MQSNMREATRTYSGQEPISLAEMTEDYLRCFKKYWLQLFLVLIAAAAVTVAFLNQTYEPAYTAKITYAVKKTGDTSVDATLTKRLSSSIDTMTKTSEFREELSANMKDSVPADSFWFSSQYTDGANLYTITVNSKSYEYVDELLEAFQKIYPSWADKSNGTVDLEVVDRVQASTEPGNTYSLIDFALKGILVGLVLAAGLATLYVQMLQTVRKEKDMKKITSKGCISVLPEVTVKKRSRSKRVQLMISNKRVDWGYKQSVLSAQSRIDLQMEKNGQKVLLVTSTLPQEGKSIFSVNMALAELQNGKKTVLIDGDLRNPSVGRIFGFDGKVKGLSDFFDGKAGAEEIIVKSGDLSVISAGTRNGGISGIISEQMMQDLMRYLRKTYDIIIIDTPPAGLFSDAEIFTKYSDMVVYMVRYDHASVREVQEGINPFIQNEKLLGYVINQSHGNFSTYGGYGRYGKYGYSRYGHYSKYSKYKRYIKEENSMNTEDSL